MALRRLVGTMECQTIASTIFVACAFIGWYAIHRKSRGTLVDVERWALAPAAGVETRVDRGESKKHESESERNPVNLKWYAFRVCSVVLVIGGVMHSRTVVTKAWRAIKGNMSK